MRVLLVKLADRLHNMRTLDHVPADKRLRIAEETMEIYAPLAGRMGMQDMREELEELAFRHINPDAHRTVTERLAEMFERSKGVIGDIEKAISALFEKHGIKATVKSRQKKPWSVFRKMETKALSFEQLSDIFGFRVIVDDGRGLLSRARRHPHDLVDGAGPLQGLHLDAQAERLPLDPHHHRRPVQPARRTADPHASEMNTVAEYGVAAHSIYKDMPASRTAPATRSPRRPTPMAGCAAPSSSWPRATTPRTSWKTPSSSCSRTRSSASRRRAG